MEIKKTIECFYVWYLQLGQCSFVGFASNKTVHFMGVLHAFAVKPG